MANWARYQKFKSRPTNFNHVFCCFLAFATSDYVQFARICSFVGIISDLFICLFAPTESNKSRFTFTVMVYLWWTAFFFHLHFYHSLLTDTIITLRISTTLFFVYKFKDQTHREKAEREQIFLFRFVLLVNGLLF